ncbi:CPBP family intramembrane glutamic endopeptidase [Rossellomorea sp. NS-SX7]|uniref:CPBP family intramembrane glutamic endopeptidase n=1 Tax=Rossellomorea sp. NS-SX7 TaxID=3463856 RepID=UPI0040588915
MVLQYILFGLFFAFAMFSTNLIREKVKGSNFKDIVRITIFFLPFLAPAIFFGLPNFAFASESGMLPYLLAIGCAIVALAIQYKDYSSFLRKEVYPLLPPITTKAFIGIESSIIGSAIFEEIFYRTYVPESVFWIECIVSGGLFSLSHYIHPLTRKTFTVRSYIILFLLSIAWYYSYKISGTLLPAIIGHLVYNSSSIVIIFRRYMFSRQEAKKLASEQKKIRKHSGMYT